MTNADQMSATRLKTTPVVTALTNPGHIKLVAVIRTGNPGIGDLVTAGSGEDGNPGPQAQQPLKSGE